MIYCIFSVLKPLTCSRQSRCPGWIYKLPGGKKFSLKVSPLSVGFPQRRPLNKKKTGVYKLPQCAIYKPPCATLCLPYIKFLHCQVLAVSYEIRAWSVTLTGSRSPYGLLLIVYLSVEGLGPLIARAPGQPLSLRAYRTPARLSHDCQRLSFIREEKGTQTQTFWSGYFRVGWGSST